ncbi:hypothetical protein U1763_10555 [Sphingomonas sp. LB2R24]|uniref:hypothetical protein n=1 Tax=Sphingomonas sorbitolis TaxID=3096165 RepID=UPI002FC884F0
MPTPLIWLVEAAVADQRSRASWNDRIWHWERPPSDHEETKIARAANIATSIVKNNAVLSTIGVKVLPQGSYYNNTNVRLEADMDLRVEIPTLMVRYAAGVSPAQADAALGYILTGKTLPNEAAEVRDQLAADCRKTFGAANVTVGNKAVSVDGLDGSHADVDLVPAFRLSYVIANSYGSYDTFNGVGITGSDGSETWNFPAQHHANGIAKRARTAHRFKKIVRAAKRLNYELCEIGAINRRLPSFLVECLVYLIEDGHFVIEYDDRFSRLLRVFKRMQELLADDAYVNGALEVNDIKYLFRDGQAWTIGDARNFIGAAIARLEA